MKLKDNTILLTGGTSGIGLEFLERFYELENNLIVTSGNPANLDNLKSKFPKILTIVCDLADSSSVRDLISKCLKEHTDINILINNAGVQYNYDWTKETDGYNKIESETRINFISPMQIIYGLLPILINKQDSAIVNVSSGLAIVPKKQAPIYCATKAAIHNGTVALRIQLEDKPTKILRFCRRWLKRR